MPTEPNSADGWFRPAALWAVGLAAALIWFAPLGYRDLSDPDEGRYSEISREMLVSGDWVTPHLNGLKYFEKPPMQYWGTALAFAALGQNDFAARLYPALAGFLSVLVVAFTARRLWGREAALYSAVVAASAFWIFALSNVVTLDIGVACFLNLALCAFLLARQPDAAPAARRRWMLLVWAAMAGGVLSKGLIGAVIPGAVLFLHMLIGRDWKILKELEWLRGLPLFFALAAPWFVLVSMRNPEFARFFFIHEHFERFLTTEHHREGKPWYFVPILIGGLLPWTSLAVAAVRGGWREGSAGRLLLIWNAFIFLFFSMSGSKLSGYIAPMFPALALLLGHQLALSPPGMTRPHAVGIAVFGAVIAVAAPLVIPHLASTNTPAELLAAAMPWAVAAGASYALGAGLSALLAGRGRRTASIVALGAAGLAFGQSLNFGYQALSATRCDRLAAQLIAGHVPADAPVFSVGYYNQTLPFYLKRTVTLVRFSGEFELGQQQEPEKWIADLPEFAERWRALPAAAGAARPDTYAELEKLGLPMTVLYRDARRVVFTKS